MTNRAWQLENFINSLVLELDKARETLAVKAVNRPLTYSVKDVALDLQLFPSYDGSKVTFITAQPGQSGASKVSLQLGSITDQQIQATSRAPISTDDVAIEEIEDIDSDTRETLSRVGVRSISDLEKMEDKKIDIGKVADGKIDYSRLAQMVKKARRGQTPPKVDKISFSKATSGPYLRLDGRNLHMQSNFPPLAVINDKLCNIRYADSNAIEIDIDEKPENNYQLVMTLDPYTICKMNIHSQQPSLNQ